jgi:hypothetical protein
MNKVKWEIVSKGDFGPIKIGMSKAEINAILGDDVAHLKAVPPIILQDIYGSKNVEIRYFERNGTKEAVCIYVNYPFKVLYKEKDLMRMSFEDAKSHLELNGIRIEHIVRGKYMWADACLSAGIGIYTSSTASRHLNFVYMFEDGYFETENAFWEEYKETPSRLKTGNPTIDALLGKVYTTSGKD